jgi:hypothetical protein
MLRDKIDQLVSLLIEKAIDMVITRANNGELDTLVDQTVGDVLQEIQNTTTT